MKLNRVYLNKLTSWKDYLHAFVIFLFWSFVAIALVLGVERIISFYVKIPDFSFFIMWIFVIPLALYIERVFKEHRELKELILTLESTLKISEQLEDIKIKGAYDYNITSMLMTIENLKYKERRT